MEHVVDGPGGRQAQLIRHRGYLFCYREGPVPFGEELRFLMGHF